MHLFIYFFIVIAAFGCSNDDRLKEFKQPEKSQTIKRTIRTIQDVEQIINSVNPSTKSTGVNIRPLIARYILKSSIVSNPDDTLLYIVEGVDKPMVISTNVRCNPIIAMFDSPGISILHELANPSESNSGLLAIIEQAIIYNQIPDDFGVYCNTKSPRSIKEEVKPKVPVEWDQRYPFNKYVPNQYLAGCGAIAVAQALMVTRHVHSFNDIPLDYDRLIQVKNRTYERDFPSETNTIARFIYEIGKSIGTSYSKESSGSPSTSFALKLFTKKGNRMLIDQKKSNIHYRLKNYSNSIVLIQSSTKKLFFCFYQGITHAYIADGYRLYSDGSDLTHINFGSGPRYNGYFLSKLTDPHFTPDSPEKYPYAWHFYCLYK